ncbi:MAG: Flp family type IVb pilin [Acidobacteriaceae bacterium]|nr:Flp family type IVb pilin [Acidobacteriaceae bacterium]
MSQLRRLVQITGQAVRKESGQDLIEYALLIAMIGLAAVGGFTTLANGINTAMTTLSIHLNSAVA